MSQRSRLRPWFRDGDGWRRQVREAQTFRDGFHEWIIWVVPASGVGEWVMHWRTVPLPTAPTGHTV